MVKYRETTRKNITDTPFTAMENKKEIKTDIEHEVKESRKLHVMLIHTQYGEDMDLCLPNPISRPTWEESFNEVVADWIQLAIAYAGDVGNKELIDHLTDCVVSWGEGKYFDSNDELLEKHGIDGISAFLTSLLHDLPSGHKEYLCNVDILRILDAWEILAKNKKDHPNKLNCRLISILQMAKACNCDLTFRLCKK